MYSLLLILLLAVPASSTAGVGAEPCDSLYTAATTTHEQIVDGLGALRATEREERRWRQSLQRSLTLARAVRRCYGPLPTPVLQEQADPEEVNLPHPTSLRHERLIETYDWMTLALRELRQYDEALARYDDFFRRFAASADSSAVAFMYHKRGYLHYQFGNLSASIADYTKVIAYTPAGETIDRIELIIDLGVILQKARDMDAALEHYIQAESLARALPPSPEARTLLARAIIDQTDVVRDEPPRDSSLRIAAYEQVIRRIEEAIELYPADAVERRARAQAGLGGAYTLVGKFETAFRELEKGRRLAERLNDPEVLALAELKIGRTYLAIGDFAAAEPHLLRAVDYAQMSSVNERQRRALHNLGRLHEMQGDWPKAETYYRRAIAVSERLRTSLRATDWAAGAFDEWIEPYHGLVRALAAQGRHEAAFLALVRTRARHLQDLRLQARLTSTLPPRSRVRFDSLTTALRDVRTALAQGDLSDTEENALIAQEVRLMAARRNVLELDVSVRVPTVDEVRKRLRPRDRALVSYYIDDPSPAFGRAPRSFAFVLTADTFRFIPLEAEGDPLFEKLSDISPLLAGSAPANLNTVQFDLEALHRLYLQLYAPLADAIPSEAPLVVIPDGALFQLPFGMLVTEPVGRFAHQDARFLIEERPIAMELSASLIADPSPIDDDYPLDFVALGRSRFDALPELPGVFRNRVDSTGGLPPLPGVRQEMEAVADLFGHRRILLDDEATEDSLYGLLDKTRVLHLASHALVHESDPLANLLVLAEDHDAETGADGLLFLHELERQQCPLDLVVLSGCSTAQGLLQAGEGPRGLQYAFRTAGAQSTLSTLWDVDDEAATAITTDFYRHLLDGAPKDVALQRAQLAYLETHGAQASPFYWAGATLYGDTRPLALEPAPLIPLVPLATSGAVLLLGALGYLHTRRRRKA